MQVTLFELCTSVSGHHNICTLHQVGSASSLASGFTVFRVGVHVCNWTFNRLFISGAQASKGHTEDAEKEGQVSKEHTENAEKEDDQDRH